MKLSERLKYNADGLVTAVAQDADNGQVLMVAHMNSEALSRTIATGDAWYFSRSRNALWRKGETSGQVQRVVEMRRDLFPDGIGFVQFIHGGGLLFPSTAPHIGADGVGCQILSCTVQPAGQDETSGKPWSILRQGHKHTLRNVFGQVRVPNHPQRGGIDEVNVPPHQFGKRRLRPALGVIAQELLVGQTLHAWNRIKIKRTIKIKSTGLRL